MTKVDIISGFLGAGKDNIYQKTGTVMYSQERKCTDRE